MSRSHGKQVREAQVVAGTPAGDEIGMSDRTAGATSPIPGGRDHITNAPTARQYVPIAVSEPEYGGLQAHGVPPSAHTFRERAELERGPNDFKPQIPTYTVPAAAVVPIPVSVVEPAWGDRALRTLAGDTFTVPAAGTPAIRIAGRDHARSHILLLVETPAGSTSVPAPATPSVPATTVPAQNPNAYPVQVVITAAGATITVVTVNGVVVGAAAGTYVVPAFGAISITYAVATPTWAWTAFGTIPALGVAPTGVRIDHEVGNLDVGKGALVRAGGASYLKLDCNDEMFAVSADGSACTLSVIYLYGIAGAG